jgi:hypothetical protein
MFLLFILFSVQTLSGEILSWFAKIVRHYRESFVDANIDGSRWRFVLREVPRVLLLICAIILAVVLWGLAAEICLRGLRDAISYGVSFP